MYGFVVWRFEGVEAGQFGVGEFDEAVVVFEDGL